MMHHTLRTADAAISTTGRSRRSDRRTAALFPDNAVTESDPPILTRVATQTAVNLELPSEIAYLLDRRSG